jgi:hypothetical protein
VGSLNAMESIIYFIFFPVAKFDKTRLLLSFIEDLDLTQFDVQTKFFHGLLDEDNYMIQFPYYED